MTDDDRMQVILWMINEADDPYRFGDRLADTVVRSRSEAEYDFYSGFWDGSTEDAKEQRRKLER